MPAGELVTVPAPARVTDRVSSGTNVAMTAVLAFISTVHDSCVPAQAAPLQPANADPEAAAAVSVTNVLVSKAVEHVAPQLTPAGLLVTVPVPAPALLTESVTCGVGGGPKFATTF